MLIIEQTNISEQNPIKVLFIARTYPPLVGGMERFAFDFYTHLSQLTQMTLIANQIGKKRIFHFFFMVMLYCIRKGKTFDIIHFNDAILSPLIPIIRIFTDAKLTATVHGLDIVYKKFGYQQFVVPFLRRADRVFPVSQYTKEQCIIRNIPDDKLQVVPNGLNFDTITHCTKNDTQSLLSKLSDNFHDLQDKIILLSLGRLIERKGHIWFIEKVFINLPENHLYFIAGDGPEKENIKGVIKRLNLDARVHLFGYVSDEEKACLFKMADLFIMPNIKDQNDQEGFGIVLLEAGSYSVPSIATNIEGIKDAVIDGVTGKLVQEKDIEGFTHAITQNEIDRVAIFESLRAVYDWKIIREKYFEAFQSLLSH